MSLELVIGTTKTLHLLIKSGLVDSGPPVGPIVGPLGLNAKKIAEDINKLTQQYKGYKVKVCLTLDRISKSYSLTLENVSVSMLFLRWRKMTKGFGNAADAALSNYSTITRSELLQFQLYCEQKKEKSIGQNSIVGTLKSMGVQVL